MLLVESLVLRLEVTLSEILDNYLASLQLISAIHRSVVFITLRLIDAWRSLPTDPVSSILSCCQGGAIFEWGGMM
jgi:hypothetical protein